MRKDRVVLPPGLDLPPTQILRRLHHVRQCRAGFWPAARFQATVRVDPQALCRNAFCRFLQQGFNPFHARYVWRVNVIDARTDFIWIIKLFKRLQQLHVGTRGFDGDDVCVQRRNRIHDVVELAITHVSVDLCVIFRHGGVDTEGLYAPLEIGVPVATTQR